MCLHHHWSIRKDTQGHTWLDCVNPGCNAHVNFTALRREYDQRTEKSPEEQRWPLERAKAS